MFFILKPAIPDTLVLAAFHNRTQPGGGNTITHHFSQCLMMTRERNPHNLTPPKMHRAKKRYDLFQLANQNRNSLFIGQIKILLDALLNEKAIQGTIDADWRVRVKQAS